MTTSTIENVGTINSVVNIFASPREAFVALKERPTFLVPLLVLLAATSALFVWYYNVVDLVWFYETSLAAADAEIPPEARERVIESAASTSPLVMGAIAAIVSSLFVVLMLLLMSAYFSAVSLMTNDGYRFKYWFSLVCWSCFPLVLGTLASMVNLGISDATFLPAQAINPLSFSSLAGMDPMETGFLARMLQSTDITYIWALGLMTVGYSQWTGKPIGTAALIVTAPVLLIVAIALAFASF